MMMAIATMMPVMVMVTIPTLVDVATLVAVSVWSSMRWSGIFFIVLLGCCHAAHFPEALDPIVNRRVGGK